MADPSMEQETALPANCNEAGMLDQHVGKPNEVSGPVTFASSIMLMGEHTYPPETKNEQTSVVKTENDDDAKDNNGAASNIEGDPSSLGLSGYAMAGSTSSLIKKEMGDVESDELPGPGISFLAEPTIGDAGFPTDIPDPPSRTLLRPSVQNSDMESDNKPRRGRLQQMHMDSMRCLPARRSSGSDLSSCEGDDENHRDTSVAKKRQFVVTMDENVEPLPSVHIEPGNPSGEVNCDMDAGDQAASSPSSLQRQLNGSFSDGMEENIPKTNADNSKADNQNGTKMSKTNQEISATIKESPAPKQGKRGGRRCTCASCVVPDCGKCHYCRDKPKFGGKNVSRQRCILKEKCLTWHSRRRSKKVKTLSAESSVRRTRSVIKEEQTKKMELDELLEGPRRKRSLAASRAPERLGFDGNKEEGDYSTPVRKTRGGRRARSSASTLADTADECSSTVTPIDADTGNDLLLCQISAEDVDNLQENPYLEGLPDAPKSEFYEEESSWRFHNPPLPTTDSGIEHNPPLPTTDSGIEHTVYSPVLKLDPLPPAPPVPSLPKTGFCFWSFNEKSRVLLANFRQPSGEIVVTRDDEVFMLRMMERDDITVVSEGLVDDLNPAKWDLDYIKGCSGDEYYHKFRGFRRTFGSKNESPKKRRGKQKSPDSEPSQQQQAEDDSNSEEVGQKNEKDEKCSTKDNAKEKNEPTSPSCSETEKTNTSVVCGETMSQDRWDDRCFVTHKEMDNCFSIKVSDYIRYLDMRQKALDRIALQRKEAGLDPVNPVNKVDATYSHSPDRASNGVEEQAKDVDSDEIFIYVDDDGKNRSLNVVDVVLYMIDYDMVKLLPPLYEDFIRNFKIPGCLPGGTHCMMNAVNVGGRPFMGPNLYLTPPGSFTHFHQDGHGTVDSGHQCLTGYNEVVMLRRLTERHKQYALQLLHGNGGKEELVDFQYDSLYGLPHADGCGERPVWPDNESIEKLREMNYYPSVFILKPGQHVHINKGRLHAFRKLSPTSLPENDCHKELRECIIQNDYLDHHEQLCMSVAWDWMFKGITSEGTNREVSSILECARLNRKHMKQSLAIPETSLLHMARNLISAVEGVKRPRLLQFSLSGSPSKRKRRRGSPLDASRPPFEPDALTTLLGIFPSLDYVITRHVAALVEAEQKQIIGSKMQRVSIGKKPNSWENPEMFSLDPYGNGDFFCKLCSEELSNVYMHCDGCEKILNKDFNICIGCHSEGRYKMKVQMHPLNPKRHSTINHTGDFERCNQKRCPCKNGPACLNCSYCAGCSCKCHRWFTLHCRFFTISDEKILLRRAKAALSDDMPSFVKETQARLASFYSRPQKAKNPSDTDSQINSQRHGSDDESKKRSMQLEPPTSPLKKEIKSENNSDDSNPEIDEEHIVKNLSNESQQCNGKQKYSTKKRVYENKNSESPEQKKARAADDESLDTPKTHYCCGKNWDLRCSSLIENVPLPHCPTSKLDLSAAALAYTAPHGTLSNPVQRGGRIGGGFDLDSFEKFLLEARDLKDPTVEALQSLLPPKSNVEKDHVRHLFRNFADSKEITDRAGNNIILLSRRETDILSFFVANDLKALDCHKKLMPYRKSTTISDLLKHIKNDKKYHLCTEYMNNVTKCVGKLLQLEEDSIGGNNLVTHSPLSPSKQDICNTQKSFSLVKEDEED